MMLWLRSWCTADPRSLAAGRIALSLVLLLDLAKRAAALETWYTNLGLLPNHTLLWRPTYPWVFSFFYMASWPWEAALGFALCLVVYLGLLVGYRTRLMQCLSFLCVLSLHGRTLFLQNGGDVVLGELCLWTLFLPTGRRYSVDSLLARLGAYEERDAAELGDRSHGAPDLRPVRSLAMAALALQLAVIYLLNAVRKTGPTWREGSAVHYVLHQDRVVTLLGVWVRGWLAPWHSRLLSYGALGIEWLLPLAILSPFGRRQARRLAVVLVLLLHGGFALFLNLGVFVPAMIAYAPNLITGEDWDALERWWRRRSLQRTVIFDGGCGVCFLVVRALARLDRAGHLSFVASGEEVPASIIVEEPAGGRRWTGAAAFAQILAALPGGLPLGLLLRLPGLRAVAELAYRAFAARRARVSGWLGLAACGVPTLPVVAVPVRSSPVPLAGGRIVALARELTVGCLMALAASRLFVENEALRRLWHFTPPRAMERATIYLQLFQGWGMFAPDAPKGDMNLVVDAVTADGRHVDPLSSAASPRWPDPGRTLPPALGQDSLFCDYIVRIAGLGAYQQAFIDWILRYPERTGRTQDRLVSFTAWIVEDDSPPPGERLPSVPRDRVLLSYPSGR